MTSFWAISNIFPALCHPTHAVWCMLLFVPTLMTNRILMTNRMLMTNRVLIAACNPLFVANPRPNSPLQGTSGQDFLAVPQVVRHFIGYVRRAITTVWLVCPPASPACATFPTYVPQK